MLAVSFSWLILQSAVLPDLEIAVPPQPPLSSVSPGVVVVEAGIDSGGSVGDVERVYGEAPFVSRVIDSVGRWRFAPASGGRRERLPLSVTVLFRPRSMFPSTLSVPVPIRDEGLEGDRPAFPTEISDPGYPPDSLAEDVVIVELRIGATGEIEGLRLVRDVPTLSDAVVKAIGSWTFRPARQSGRAVPGLAVVAVSFLRPVVDTRP